MVGKPYMTTSLCSKQTTLIAAEATQCTTLSYLLRGLQRAMSAQPAAKKPRADGRRLTLQLTFNNEGSMKAFKERMEALKTVFAPSPLKPVELMAKLFDLAEAHLANTAQPLPPSTSSSPAEASQHLLPYAGTVHC